MHNIQISIKVTERSREYTFHEMMYIMAPDEEAELFATVSEFNRGIKATVRQVVQLAYWSFLKENDCEVESSLIPPIVYKFDRSRQIAVVEADDFKMQIWVQFIA